VANIAVAMDAGGHFTVVVGGPHLVYDISMAVEACALRYFSIAWLDLNWFMEVFQRERERVKESVVSLYDPFANRMVRQMAIIAHGDVPMARVLPGIVMTLHDVAVGAGRRVVAQIAPSLAVPERERADASEDAKQNGQKDRKEGSASPPLSCGRSCWIGFECIYNGVVHNSLRRDMCFEGRLDWCLEYLRAGFEVKYCVNSMAIRS
jgi:hypothetical protein